MSAKPRLWLGGSFNPVHYGHLRLAEQLANQLGEVLLLPLASHAFGKQLASAEHRVAMLELALGDFPQLHLDRSELDCPDVGQASYTVTTLARLRAHYGPDAHLSFVLGEDALADLPRWKQAERLLALANLVVLKRCRTPTATPAMLAPHIASLETWRQVPHGRLVFWHNLPMQLSSTRIRQLVARRAWSKLDGELPPQVINYIREVGLYS